MCSTRRAPYSQPVNRFLGLALAAAVLLLAPAATVLAADDWPQWGGPRGNGVVAAPAALTGAPGLAFEVAWRRPLGPGYSSVVVAGGKAITTATVDGRDRVVAVDAATGEEAWRFDLGPAFLGRSGSEDGPLSTPAVADDRVFALAPEGRLVALSRGSGEKLWEKSLADDFGAPMQTYGFSTAPLVAGDRLVVLAGGADGSMLVALEAATGETLWQAGADSVAYQNPTLGEIAGVEQVVAVSDRELTGFALADGSPLWQVRLEGEDGEAQVGVLDDDRVLVRHGQSTTLYRVAKADGGLAAEAVWDSPDLKGTYVVPIRHGEHLYGFSSAFMTCVSLRDGSRVWKSRPPAGLGLTGLGGYLLTLGKGGDLVAVHADPAGYREAGRLPLFDNRRVYPPPSFGEGLIFVRNMDELVAVRPLPAGREQVAAAGPAEIHAAEASALASMLEKAHSAGSAAERQALVQAFLDAHETSPAIDAGEAQFFFHGEVPDLAISGTMTGSFEDHAMHRLDGTDFYYRAYPVETGARWTYRYKVFEESRPDPGNPLKVDGGRAGEISAIELPGWQEPAYLTPCEGCPKGTLHEVKVPVDDREEPLAMTVYTPPGYEADGSRRYPLVIWTEGKEAREKGRLADALDNLIAAGAEGGSSENGGISPVVAVFLELPGNSWWGEGQDWLVETMNAAVLPHLEEAFRIQEEPAARAVVAQHWTVINALKWALGAPVGRFAAQSPFLSEAFLERELPEWLDGREGFEVYVGRGGSDAEYPAWGLDVPAHSRRMAEAFRGEGLAVREAETPGGPDWSRWSAATGEILRGFFPAAE